MNAYLRFDGIEIWQLAGWTMLHFLWLGTLVGLGAGACRLLLRQASPNSRYVLAITTLTLLASLPLAIAAWLVTTYPTDFLSEDAPAAIGFAVRPTATPTQNSPPIDQTIGEIIELSGRNEATPSDKVRTAPGFAGGLPTDGDLTSDQAAVPTAPRQSRGLTDGALVDTTWPDVIFESLQSFALYLPWIWLVGTPITFALLATGLVGTRRLRLASRPIHDGPIAELLAQLTTSLHVGQRVGLAVCDRIATPVLVGILRPIILLPPAALTGWSPDEIEMVLLHELAHVRRWDNLVNLVQRIVESLLFFHPVVWLVSNWIRRERETCCDALVVDRTKKPHAYAELLVALAAELPRSVLFQPAASSAMAAGALRNRIRRILQLEDDPMLVSGKSLALVLGSLLIAATLAVLYLPSIGQAEESTTEDTESTESTQNHDKRAVGVRTDDVRKTIGVSIPRGERATIVLRHPISADDVSRAVKELNSQGHNVTIRAAEGATLLLTNVARTNSRFPSLEDQKLADLAFKRLGLELETLDDEDLRRVKALGYDGGVKVTSGAAGEQHGFIQPTDIIVGLHVWPTTNMEDVAAVLNRDDLAELNPLKFYVVRKRGDESNKDEVITGRVSVNLPAGGWGATRSTAPAAPQSAAPAGDLSKYVAEAMTDAGIDPKSGPVQVEMVPHESGSALVVRGAANTDPDIPRYVLPSAGEEDSHPKWPQTDIPGMTPRPPRSRQPQSGAAPPSPETSAELPSRPAASPTNLRYEGKTFEEWRDASRIELSTERHLAAVQALAAFGANGYASDATEAILDVAGKYDFRIDVQRQSAESNLRSAIRRSFTLPRGIDPKIAFPMIMKRYSDAPEVWHGFVVYLLSWRVPLESKEMVELARPLLEHQDPEMRAAALEAIYRTNPDDSDEILAAALRDTSQQVVAKALEIVASNEDRNIDRQSEPTGLNLRHVDFPVEEFVAILVSFRPDGFNPNEGAVRQILTDLSPESADRVRNQLLEIVNDPSRKDHHLYAIRAIGAIRRGRSSGAQNPSIPILEKIVRESDDLNLRVAAAGAIGRIGGRSRFSLDHLSDELDNLPDDAPERDQMRELIDAERRGNW